jgi:hypothetical protein
LRGFDLFFAELDLLRERDGIEVGIRYLLRQRLLDV